MRTGENGSSLTEVLLASIVLATSVLSLLTLQSTVYGVGLQAQNRQQASLLLLDLTEIAQLDIQQFQEIDLLSVMQADYTEAACTFGAVCNAGVFIRGELVLWAGRVRESLPDARVELLTDIWQGQIVSVMRLTWFGPALFAQNSMEVVLPR